MIKHLIYTNSNYLQINRICSLFRRNSYCVILAYHRVSPLNDRDYLLREMIVDPVSFEKQMLFLIKNYTVVSLNKFLGILECDRNQSNYAVITFDDAYLDSYEYAFPILKKYNLSATIFVPTDFIETGRHFWWDRLANILVSSNKQSLLLNWKDKRYNLKIGGNVFTIKAFKKLCYLFKFARNKEKEGLLNLVSKNLNVVETNSYPSNLTWRNIREMSQNNISFGAHTHTHSAVSSVSDSEFKEELLSPKETLENRLNQAITAFAYPYGEKSDFNIQSVNAIKQLGYKVALTMIQRPIISNDDLFVLPRIGIGGYDTEEIFRLKLSGSIPLF